MAGNNPYRTAAGTMGSGKAGAAGCLLALVWTIAAGAMPAGTAQAQAEQPIFKDIQGHWAEQAVSRLVEQGILDGFPDGTFRPDAPVTADQFIKMLLLSYSSVYPNGERVWKNSFTESLSPANREVLQQDYWSFSFKPSLTGYWAKPFIDLAADLHFITKSQFPDFKANLRREQVAEIIYFTMRETEYLEDETLSQTSAKKLSDYLSAKERERRFVAEAYGKGIMEGYAGGYFGMGREVTRAEALTILDRIANKTARVATAVNQGSPELQRVVPTPDGHYKKVVFPTVDMAAAYNVMTEAARLRGTNYDLVETTAKLYKDATAKAQDLRGSGTEPGAEQEAVLWMEPAYRTYGVTVSVQPGVLARNQESVFQYTNHLFGHDALAFRELFEGLCRRAEAGEALEPATAAIGRYKVEARPADARTVLIFTIMEKK